MNEFLYAGYEGEELCVVGKIEEVARFFGVTINTARYYMTPTWKRRGEMTDTKRTVYRIDEREA